MGSETVDTPVDTSTETEVTQDVTTKPGDTPAAPAAPPAAPAEDPKGYWPADWRSTVSKGDAKILGRMERYASPEAAMQALIAAQNRISAGELKPVLGKDATPEQIKEWRDAHGIPEAPDKYALSKDVKVDHLDKSVLDTVLAAAHASNQTPEQISATLKAWNQIETMASDKRAEADQKVQKDAEDLLRAEWGGEYRRNINLIQGLLDGQASPELKDKFLNGRLSDGTPIGSSPDALKMLASLALINNPTGTIVPGSEGNMMMGVNEEIAKIEGIMRTNRQTYNKDEAMQARYRELLAAREKLQPKS